MEQISSTFPFQDGLLHFSPIISSSRQQTRPQILATGDLNNNNNPLVVFDLLKAAGGSDGGGDEKMMNPNNNNNNNYNNINYSNNNPMERKIVRRDVERQRRKEMGSLYKSLVGLIPYEYIKGKRSTSDRLQETVRYVKDLRNRVEKLSAKRDELKGVVEPSNNFLFGTSSSGLMKGQDGSLSCDDDRRTVAVKPCRAGVEVTINVSANRTNGVCLSKILRVLVEEGLSINNSSSIKVNDRLLHTIEAEVIGGGPIDPIELEQKLALVVYNDVVFII